MATLPDREGAFRAAFVEHYGPLHRYVHRRVGRSLADEIAAETFATAYVEWGRFDSARPLRPWLYGIAANLVRRHYRDEERMLRAYARSGIETADVSETDVAARLDARSDRQALAAALAELRGQEREVLLLHAWAELSDQEIAAALSLPVGTVKSRLSRARTHVRNRIGRSGQPAGESAASDRRRL